MTKRVCENSDEKLVTINALALKPTHAHTFDSNLTFWGARLLDSECKLTANADHKSMLVFYSADQLAFKDTTLLMLTTNTTFKFFNSTKNRDTRKISTIVCEMQKFKLGSVTDIAMDTDAQLDCNHGYRVLHLSYCSNVVEVY